VPWLDEELDGMMVENVLKESEAELAREGSRNPPRLRLVSK